MNEREMVEFLFGLLDDIDTMDDLAKDNDVAYRAQVRRLQAKRWKTGITTDGYILTIPGDGSRTTSSATKMLEAMEP